MPLSRIPSDLLAYLKLTTNPDSSEAPRMKLGSSAKYFIFVVWCCACFVAALLIFASGLLLHRNVLPHKSSCVQPVAACRSLKTQEALENCLLAHSARPIDQQICTESNFKIVLVIVDALRYDFIEYDEGSTESYHTNKLLLVRDLLVNESNRSRLFKFVADPPTTTMQRILGLTTGSLPTFIDVGSNFASSEIDEDNIVDMLNRHEKKVVFLGDDTWTKLYPNRFVRSYPFDSFNVWDLDTVDYGIREHLFTELRRSDWSLLIAHFLGVDHCGHRYGPYHPEMKRKLGEMNEILRSIVDHIKHQEDTLLFVIGDHGMTSTGDHGGDTENEISTALFVYSPVHDLFSNHQNVRVMRQVDMAPTFSSILGLPIPFSSVGSVILECFPVTLVGSLSETVFQLWRNIEQITNYVVEYSLHNAQLRVTKKIDATLLHFHILKEIRTSITSDLATFRREYQTFMTDILAMCRDVWVQFDMLAIGCGLCFLLATTLLCYCICESLSPSEFLPCHPEYKFVFIGKIIFLLSLGVMFITHLFGANVDFRTLLTIAIICTSVLVWWCRRLCTPIQLQAVFRRLTVFNVFVTVLLLVTLCGLFSNSFIIEEPSVILFLTCSLLWVQFLFHRPPKVWTQLTLLLYTAGTCVTLRVSLQFLKCHEEQTYCQDIMLKKYETRLCAVSIVAVALLVANWLRSRPPRFYACVAVLCSLLLAVNWICETCFEHLTFAQDIPVITLSLTVCSIYHLLLTPKPRNLENHPRSSFDTSFSSVAVFLALLGCVVLGQTYTVPVVLMVAYCRSLTVFLCSSNRFHNSEQNSPQIPWNNVFLWSMSSIYWFYVTGHYASFAGIQWNAAFLLQKEIGNRMFIPGILVILNTFFSYVVHGITLPILFVTQWISSPKPVLPSRSVSEAITKNNEIHPHTLEYLYYGVFKLIMQYLTLFGLRLFFVSLSATVLSRHLMMWKIFAPKFIFEAIAFMVSIISLLLGFICVCRIGNEIHADKVVQNKRSA